MKWLLKKLAQRYLLVSKSDIKAGDLVTHVNNDAIYEAIGIYYSFELKPFVFMRDERGRIHGAPQYEYRRVNDPKKIQGSKI